MLNFVKHIQSPGRVIWVTGLSGSGKTTLCEEILRQLRDKRHDVIGLDGDELRKVFSIGANNISQSHDRNARLKLSMTYAHLSKTLSSQGFIVACFFYQSKVNIEFY